MADVFIFMERKLKNKSMNGWVNFQLATCLAVNIKYGFDWVRCVFIILQSVIHRFLFIFFNISFKWLCYY